MGGYEKRRRSRRNSGLILNSYQHLEHASRPWAMAWSSVDSIGIFHIAAGWIGVVFAAGAGKPYGGCNRLGVGCGLRNRLGNLCGLWGNGKCFGKPQEGEGPERTKPGSAPHRLRSRRRPRLPCCRQEQFRSSGSSHWHQNSNPPQCRPHFHRPLPGRRGIGSVVS